MFFCVNSSNLVRPQPRSSIFTRAAQHCKTWFAAQALSNAIKQLEREARQRRSCWRHQRLSGFHTARGRTDHRMVEGASSPTATAMLQELSVLKKKPLRAPAASARWPTSSPNPAVQSNRRFPSTLHPRGADRGELSSAPPRSCAFKLTNFRSRTSASTYIDQKAAGAAGQPAASTRSI